MWADSGVGFDNATGRVKVVTLGWNKEWTSVKTTYHTVFRSQNPESSRPTKRGAGAIVSMRASGGGAQGVHGRKWQQAGRGGKEGRVFAG